MLIFPNVPDLENIMMAASILESRDLGRFVCVLLSLVLMYFLVTQSL